MTDATRAHQPRRISGVPALGRALLLGLVVAGCGAATTPTPSPAAATASPATPVVTLTPATPTPLATAAPTAIVPTPVGGSACGVADLKASHGLVDGAAGSIFTQVVLEAASDCTVETSPSVGLQDKSGADLVTATPAGPGSIELKAGSAYTTTIRLANWCSPEPAFPLSLVLWIDSEKLVVTGGSFPEDGMPGCLGSGGVRLESTAWVVSP